MDGSMKPGGGCPMAFGHGDHQYGIPLIPAPMAMFAMLFGVMIGVMIGRRKATMHRRALMGSGMGMGTRGACGDAEWMDRKRLMHKMAMHHHHGDGHTACSCGSPEVPSSSDEPSMGGHMS